MHHQNHRKIHNLLYPLYWWPHMDRAGHRENLQILHSLSRAARKMRREKIKSEFDALGPQSKAGSRQHYAVYDRINIIIEKLINCQWKGLVHPLVLLNLRNVSPSLFEPHNLNHVSVFSLTLRLSCLPLACLHLRTLAQALTTFTFTARARSTGVGVGLSISTFIY